MGRCIVRLISPDAGQVLLDGTDVTHLSPRRLRPLRPKMHMVFHDPYSSLNPRLRVSEIVASPLRAQRRLPRAELGDAVSRLLGQAGLPAEIAGRYLHELSGGQRQRVGLARCPVAQLPLCRDEVPPVITVPPGHHLARCYLVRPDGIRTRT